MNELVGLLIGLVSATVLLHVVARLVFLPVSTRLLGQAPWLPEARWDPIPDGQPWETTTADGLQVRGTYFPGATRQRAGTIIFCHALNGDRWNVLPYLAWLRQHGFDLYTFDFRNHGQSGRTAGYKPMPWVSSSDVADLRAVIQYVVSRQDGDGRGIGLLGISKGASVAVCAAAGDARVRALVLDSLCPLEGLQAWCTRMLVAQWLGSAHRAGTLASWLLWPAGLWAKCLWGWRRRCRLLSTARATQRLRAPVLLIHGQCDAHVPPETVASLRRRLRAPHELWTVPRAKHGGAVSAAPEEYARRVSAFLLEHLARWPVSESVEIGRSETSIPQMREPASVVP